MPFRGNWDPQYVQYNTGDVVSYNGNNYEIIQPHRSQADWPPSATPALWKDIGNSSDQAHTQAPDPQPWNPVPAGPPPVATPTQPAYHDNGYTTHNGANVSNEDMDKKWWQLDEDKKKVLFGGGLALGLAALGGAYYQHEKHRKSGQDEMQQAWEVQNWIVSARQRTDDFLQNGPRGPTTWIFHEALNAHPNLATSLIQGGEEDGKPWYIARAPHSGSLQPGKCRAGVGAIIGYGNEAIQLKQYELLVGNHQGIRWVPARNKLDINSLGARPIEGGKEGDGTPLYIARAHAHGGVHPGKASTQLKGGYITYNGKEHGIENYEVLCYA